MIKNDEFLECDWVVKKDTQKCKVYLKRKYKLFGFTFTRTKLLKSLTRTNQIDLYQAVFSILNHYKTKCNRIHEKFPRIDWKFAK